MGDVGFDAILFDLDDTLIDWWGSISRCLGDIADDRVVDALLGYCRRELWLDAPGGDYVWHRNTWALHHRRQTIWPEVLDWLDHAELELLMKRFDDELWVGFYPETVPTLDGLVDSTRLAVLSNNHLIDDEAERLRLGDWFELATAPPRELAKPNPEAFLTVCRQLGVEPGRTVYVGDSIKSDVLGALGAGLIPVWHDRWDDPWPDPPVGVHRVATLAELPAVLEAVSRPGPDGSPPNVGWTNVGR